MKSKIRFTVLYFLLFVIMGVEAQTGNENDEFSYAIKLYNQEFYDLAAQQFIKYYNKYPNSVRIDEAKYYAGMSLFLLGEFNQARIEFQSLALEFPQSPKAGDSWYKMGECFTKLGNFPEAVKAYESIKILQPNHALAASGLFKAGSLRLTLGEYESALLNFSTILDRYQESSEYYPAMVRSAASLFNKGDIEAAQNLLKKVSGEQIPAVALSEAYLLSAQIYMELGNYHRAEKDFLIIIKDYAKSEQYIDALMNYCDIQTKKNNYSEALIYLKKALSEKIKPEYKNIISLRLADTYYLTEKFALADKEYQKLDKEPCDSLYVIIRLKQFLSQKKQGLTREALSLMETTFEECQEINHVLSDKLLNVYLDLLEESVNYERAAALLNETLFYRKDYQKQVELVLRLVQNYSRIGKWREIIREAQALVRLQEKIPEKDDLIYFLALSYENISDFSNAVYYYEQLTREYASSPYFNQSKNRLEYLSDYEVIDQDKTLAGLTELIGRSFGDEDRRKLQFELGKLYYSELKEYDKAEQVFEQLINHQLDYQGDVFLFLGKTHLKQAYKNPDDSQTLALHLREAKKYFTKAVESLQSCSVPDKASWQLVYSTILQDTIPINKQIMFIEKLIKTYPQSELLERWYAELAFSLAFEAIYSEASL